MTRPTLERLREYLPIRVSISFGDLPAPAKKVTVQKPPTPKSELARLKKLGDCQEAYAEAERLAWTRLWAPADDYQGLVYDARSEAKPYTAGYMAWPPDPHGVGLDIIGRGKTLAEAHRDALRQIFKLGGVWPDGPLKRT